MRKFLSEGQAMPFGYAPVGYDISRMQIQVAVIPYNYLLRLWHTILAKYRMPEYQRRVARRIYRAKKEGYDKGFQDGGMYALKAFERVSKQSKKG